jgi:hypothetical protein
MALGGFSITPGKVHRQVEGDDMRETTIVGDVAGRPLTLSILLPASFDQHEVNNELRERALTIVALFAGTPFRVAHDGISPAEAPTSITAGHTMSQIGGPV